MTGLRKLRTLETEQLNGLKLLKLTSFQKRAIRYTKINLLKMSIKVSGNNSFINQFCRGNTNFPKDQMKMIRASTDHDIQRQSLACEFV